MALPHKSRLLRPCPVILSPAESAMPWIYWPMNHVEERLSVLHFWIWENIQFSWSCLVVATSSSIEYLQYWNSVVVQLPQWSCPASKVQSLLLCWGLVLGGISQGSECSGTPLFWFMWMNGGYAFTDTEWVTSTVCLWHLSDLLWWCRGVGSNIWLVRQSEHAFNSYSTWIASNN